MSIIVRAPGEAAETYHKSRQPFIDIVLMSRLDDHNSGTRYITGMISFEARGSDGSYT